MEFVTKMNNTTNKTIKKATTSPAFPKKQKEFKVTTVLINASPDENTEKFSDEIVEVSEHIDKEAGQVFGI